MLKITNLKKTFNPGTINEKVALDGKKRFSSFVPGNDKQYKEAISNYIKTILPVWMQYRNMYINI